MTSSFCGTWTVYYTTEWALIHVGSPAMHRHDCLIRQSVNGWQLLKSKIIAESFCSFHMGLSNCDSNTDVHKKSYFLLITSGEYFSFFPKLHTTIINSMSLHYQSHYYFLCCLRQSLEWYLNVCTRSHEMNLHVEKEEAVRPNVLNAQQEWAIRTTVKP